MRTERDSAWEKCVSTLVSLLSVYCYVSSSFFSSSFSSFLSLIPSPSFSLFLCFQLVCPITTFISLSVVLPHQRASACNRAHYITVYIFMYTYQITCVYIYSEREDISTVGGELCEETQTTQEGENIYVCISICPLEKRRRRSPFPPSPGFLSSHCSCPSILSFHLLHSSSTISSLLPPLSLSSLPSLFFLCFQLVSPTKTFICLCCTTPTENIIVYTVNSI